MPYRVTVLPQNQHIEAMGGDTLLTALRRAGRILDAPCGGDGRCGKCRVIVDGVEMLACQTEVDRDMTVIVPHAVTGKVFTDTAPVETPASCADGYLLAFDIGTTTVVGYLLEGKTGRELATVATKNPQISYGADVISRIRHGLQGQMAALTDSIRDCLEELTLEVCRNVGISPDAIGTVSAVGNPAMQQFLLGIPVDNLAKVPFAPVLTQRKTIPAREILPLWENAEFLVVPDIAGFVGADTVACILACRQHVREEMTLMVDIGTNGEMVLGNRHKMVACSTAAGPALEGANIQFGMRAGSGAIDHVWLENGVLRYSVIGGGQARGICGSGLIDAVATALDMGLLNTRGRIQNESRRIDLTDEIYLTQEDIRQVQLAKGAIAAGISLMAAHLEISLEQIQQVCLAGAFGSYMRPESACRIGLLPALLEAKIEAVGNAAGSGAKLLAVNREAFVHTTQLLEQIESLELGDAPGFQRSFAQNMRFDTAEQYWMQKALAMGFTAAVPLNVSALQPRKEVRDMCAADKCGAYGKNWTCPPYCGTLEDCEAKMQGYSRGLLLQTVGKTEKTIDTKAYRRTEQQHLAQFAQLAAAIRAVYPEALCLGAGGCRVCTKCAYPEVCRFPEKACSSMEAYGLFVTHVCRDHGLAYHHGEKTITYTACILF